MPLGICFVYVAVKVNLKYHNILGSYLLFLSKSTPPCQILAPAWQCSLKEPWVQCATRMAGKHSHISPCLGSREMLISHTPHSHHTLHHSVCHRTPINSESWCMHIISHAALLTGVSCRIFVLRMSFLKSYRITRNWAQKGESAYSGLWQSVDLCVCKFQCSLLRLHGTEVEVIYNAKCYFFYFKE